MGVCNCSMFCCTLLYVYSSIAIILMGKRKLVASLNLSSWCLVMVEQLFLAVPQGCLRFVIVVFPDHTHLLFLKIIFYCRLFTDYEIKYFKTIKFHHIITNATKLEGSNFQEDVFKWSPGIWLSIVCFMFREHTYIVRLFV